MWSAAAKPFAFFFVRLSTDSMLVENLVNLGNSTAYTYNKTRTSATELKHAIALSKPKITKARNSGT